jgi:RNA polymerase sigma factor (sigma-70 family)
MIKSLEMTDASDASLVAASLTGNRDAFGQIVARYQTLVCSLAYSATGNLNQSEDLAQETFLAAWKQLTGLREPQKLRSWLCGIARNLTYDSLKKQGREPSHVGESLDVLEATPAAEPAPHDFAISQEEASILWRSIERIPEIYREPLVLFYREHQSIEAVAQNLELTEDTVKQRLSRGRKLLHEEVVAFIEGALERTNPGKAFTIGVLAALPALATSSAKAAAIATVAAKGGAAAKSTGMLTVLSALLWPLLVLFGNYLPYRMSLAGARSDEERRRIKKLFRTVFGGSIVLSLAAVGGMLWAFHGKGGEPLRLLDLVQVWFACLVIVYLLLLACAGIFNDRKYRRHLASVLAREHNGVFPAAAYEYRSRAEFLGLPLVHIRLGDRFSRLRPPIKAWIAFGHHAVGGLFAFGATAVAPFAIGGMAIGVFTLGGFVAGGLSFGAFAFGVGAQGVIALGWQSAGFCAVAWSAATGAFAFAHDFATAAFAHALQANTDAARQFIDSAPILRFFRFENRHSLWINFLWIAPLFIQWRLIARSRRREQSAA